MTRTDRPLFDVVMGAIVEPLTDDERDARASRIKREVADARGLAPEQVGTHTGADGRTNLVLPGWQEPEARPTVECPRPSCRGYLRSRELGPQSLHYLVCDECGTTLR